MFFSDFISFLKFDMKSRDIRLDKEDNMTIDGAILTADSHGDKLQCNTLCPRVTIAPTILGKVLN